MFKIEPGEASSSAVHSVVTPSGAVFAYDGSAWAGQSTPTSENLNAIVLSTSSTPAIAVGAGGTVVER